MTGVFDSIVDFFHPSGAADRAQLREGERLLTAAGYQWAYGTGEYGDPPCEFCNRKMPTVFLLQTKINPLGQKFRVYDRLLQACPYCRYIEAHYKRDRNRTTFDKMVDIYPP
jgi:hypothetical protein